MVLVVGDSMLDRYWEGAVDRISPEAPVPVLQVKREYCRPGGAANVAANLAALGSPTTLLTMLGEDQAGDTLTDLVRAQGIELRQVVGARTHEKIRFVASRQQLLRADFDEPENGDGILAAYLALEPEGVVVFSDYAKGALDKCRDMLEASPKCKALVDPKGDCFNKYRGCWLLKPNEAEVRAVVGSWTGEAEFRRKCAELREFLRVEYLLVTRGDRGMMLFGRQIIDVASEARDVYDLSGAGDTVLATLAHFVSNDWPVVDAMKLANKAAGIVVGKFGTATITKAELTA